MAWRARWLAVTLARSVMARLAGCGNQHAGNQARQDLECGTARGLVELFPEAGCEALRKSASRWIGRVEKGQIQLHEAPLLRRGRSRRIGRGERRRDGATEANRQGCQERASRHWLPGTRAHCRNDPRPS